MFIDPMTGPAVHGKAGKGARKGRSDGEVTVCSRTGSPDGNGSFTPAPPENELLKKLGEPRFEEQPFADGDF
jgi:hypothetical protein